MVEDEISYSDTNSDYLKYEIELINPHLDNEVDFADDEYLWDLKCF
jgi:hypothetical protein